MTEKSFKFRYANEIVGGFVLLSLILLVATIFLAARAQGWMEQKAVLRTTFNTEKGAFGLREGAEVMIMDTLAGSVGKILPDDEGYLQTTFHIKSQFLAGLKKGAIAKVQKKFGFAGDSIVVIENGTGEPLADKDFIECRKDDEIMDTAKKALADVQEILKPIMKEMRGSLENINKVTGGIAESLDKGSGLAGTLLKDDDISKEVRRVVDNVNSLVVGTRDAVGETRRLIKGVQKHWLWRRYMDKDSDPELILQTLVSSSELDSEIKHFKSELDLARAANDSAAIAQNSYNLAVCALEISDTKNAVSLLGEARAELLSMKKDTLSTYVMEAQALKKEGRIDEALEIARKAEKMLKWATEHGVELQCRVVLADLVAEKGDISGAKACLKKIESLSEKVESPVIKSMAAGVTARINMLEKKYVEAAAMYDEEASLLKNAGLFEKMAKSLEFAGNAYVLANMHLNAADRYFRSGRSLFFSGNAELGRKNAELAAEMAKTANDSTMVARVSELFEEMRKTQDVQ